MNNKSFSFHLYCSLYLTNSKGFRSSLPGRETKIKYAFLIINHAISQLNRRRDAPAITGAECQDPGAEQFHTRGHQCHAPGCSGCSSGRPGTVLPILAILPEDSSSKAWQCPLGTNSAGVRVQEPCEHASLHLDFQGHSGTESLKSQGLGREKGHPSRPWGKATQSVGDPIPAW